VQEASMPTPERGKLKGYARLGIPYPMTNWATAWELIRSQAVEAVNVLREEIQRDTST
jgi:hypothetical protein